METWRRTSPVGRTLLLVVLLTGTTTFMFLPLLAVELTARGIPAGRAGLLVGLLAFCSQGFALISGPLTDRLGARPVMLAGFALRITGYPLLGLGSATGQAATVAGLVLIGVGGSLLGLSVKTLLIEEAGADRRAMLALRSTFVNLGVVAGPALGAAAYPLGFRTVLAACVLSHLVLGLRLALRPVPRTGRRPHRAGAGTGTGVGAEAGMGAGGGGGMGAEAGCAAGFALRQWLPLGLLALAYWALYSQLNVLLPLTATELTGSTTAISVVFALNGALVVLLQYVLLARVLRRAGPRGLLLTGFLAFGCAYATLLPQAGMWSLLLFVLPITLAEMLIGPALDEQAVAAAPAGRTGLALGLIGAAGALGSLGGAALGGGLAQHLGGAGAAPVIIALALAAAATCLLLPRTQRRGRPAPVAAAALPVSAAALPESGAALPETGADTRAAAVGEPRKSGCTPVVELRTVAR
ncbi:MFS transporter [Kitasatospora sp. NPDC054939]